MAGPVNNFQIKRAAHHLSRQNPEQTWNPFGHLNWGHDRDRDRPRRSSTWSGPDPEAQRSQPDAEGIGSPLGYSMSTAAFLPRRGGGVEGGEDCEARTTSQPESGDTMVDDSVAASRTDSAVRKRKPEGSKEDGERELAVEEKKKRKEGEETKGKPLFKHVYPKTPFTIGNQIQRTIFNSWINILLLAVPAGIAIKFTPVTPVAVFIVNFIAIIPLAAMLSFATEEIALRTGETLGGLLNATFGNAVELIVAIMALLRGQVTIVQTSLLGSILSNLLLVMGMCFFFGGLRRQEQFFNTTVAQTAASLLALAIAGIIVPTVFDYSSLTSVQDVAELSRGTAVILLVVYGGYLFFQLKTHQEVFAQESQKVEARPFKHRLKKGAVRQAFAQQAGMMAPGLSNMEGHMNMAEHLRSPLQDDEDGEGEEPQLHFWVAVATLVGSTVLIAFCAQFLVDAIDYVVIEGGISEEFLGLILLPIVGNAAEHATAVTVAIKDKMDLAIGVAIGSSMQVSLFLIPLLVIIGWGMDNPYMSLSFDVFQVAVLFVSVLLVNYLIGDGKSHWLEGMLLMCLYCIIAVCSWCKSLLLSPFFLLPLPPLPPPTGRHPLTLRFQGIPSPVPRVPAKEQPTPDSLRFHLAKSALLSDKTCHGRHPPICL